MLIIIGYYFHYSLTINFLSVTMEFMKTNNDSKTRVVNMKCEIALFQQKKLFAHQKN